MIRKLKPEEVTFSISVEMDDTPVRGNALASGDSYVDRQEEDLILKQLNNGNIWAWACVKVTATWKGYSEYDILGGCSYESEEEFKADCYYEDMKDRALEELQNKLESAAKDLEGLEE